MCSVLLLSPWAKRARDGLPHLHYLPGPQSKAPCGLTAQGSASWSLLERAREAEVGGIGTYWVPTLIVFHLASTSLFLGLGGGVGGGLNPAFART